MANNEIVFNEDRQHALLGHMLSDPKVLAAARLLKVDPAAFFSDHWLQMIGKELYRFEEKYHRSPSIAELKAVQGLVADKESKAPEKISKAFDKILALKKDVGFDVLVDDLKTARMATILREGIEKGVEQWNRADMLQSLQTVEAAVLACQATDYQGVTASTYDTETWSIRERADRDSMKNQIIPTGLKFIDEAMGGGVAPTDLVLLASKTGVGKSQLMYQIALSATTAGKKVFLLALEADQGEMQRRTKFPALMRLYRLAKGLQAPDIDYVRYCHGEYTDLLAPFEEAAHQEYVKKYSSLQTLYKHSASYTTEDMERDIMRMAPHVDLILLDHLHYVDGNEKENENQAAKRLIKKLREIGQSMRKPIIAAAHVRKTDGPRKFAPILPGVEDIMGSSDLVKVATHVILLGPTMGLDDDQFDIKQVPEGAKIDGTATLVRMVKSRTAGVERTQYTAACFFQQRDMRYDANYLLGRLHSADTKWSPVFADQLPKWTSKAARWKAPSSQA